MIAATKNNEITVYEDKSFTFVCKTPPAAILIKEKLGIEHGSGIPQLTAVGTLTEDQLREIAEIKMPDLNANTVEAAMEIIAGTARSMGVRIEGREMKKSYVPSRKVAAMLQGKEPVSYTHLRRGSGGRVRRVRPQGRQGLMRAGVGAGLRPSVRQARL